MSEKNRDDEFLKNFLASAETFLKGKDIDRTREARRRSRNFISGKTNASNPMEKSPFFVLTDHEDDEDD